VVIPSLIQAKPSVAFALALASATASSIHKGSGVADLGWWWCCSME